MALLSAAKLLPARLCVGTSLLLANKPSTDRAIVKQNYVSRYVTVCDLCCWDEPSRMSRNEDVPACTAQ
jgi:hypothetical protein